MGKTGHCLGLNEIILLFITKEYALQAYELLTLLWVYKTTPVDKNDEISDERFPGKIVSEIQLGNLTFFMCKYIRIKFTSSDLSCFACISTTIFIVLYILKYSVFQKKLSTQITVMYDEKVCLKTIEFTRN